MLVAVPIIFLFVGVVYVRASVALANWILGPVLSVHHNLPEPQLQDVSVAASYDEAANPENPYSAPGHISVATEIPTRAIPEPGVGRSMVVVAVQWLVSQIIMAGFLLFLQRVLLMTAQPSPSFQMLLFWARTLLGAGANAALLKFILPTTFRRGMLVSVIQLVLSLVIGAGLQMAVPFLLR